MFYEIATLELRLWGAKKAMEGLSAFAESPESRGSLLGCWEVDVGSLGRMLVLRGFDTAEALVEDRQRLLRSSNPFNAGEVLNGFTVDSYVPFPFMPPVQPGQYGRLYEFREYQLAVGGITPSMAAWEEALPARQAISPVVIAMHAMDGPPRMLHIVPYESFEARLMLRKELYMKGIWPPKGAPEQITRATSTIALPTPISKLA